MTERFFDYIRSTKPVEDEMQKKKEPTRASTRKPKQREQYCDLSLLDKKKSNSRRLPKGYYEVESLLSKRSVDGKPQYLVKWKGYSMNHCTWEPLENLSRSEVKQMVEELDATMKKVLPTPTSPVSPTRKRTLSINSEEENDMSPKSKSKSKRLARKNKNETTVKLDDGSTGYVVERLLRRRFRDGDFQYLVKWLGYPVNESTWEPVGHLDQVLQMVQECDAEYNAMHK